MRLLAEKSARPMLGVALLMASLGGAMFTSAPAGADTTVGMTGAPSAPSVGVAPTGTGGTAPTYTWPELDHDPSLTGYSPDPALSTTNANSLGVSWMTDTGAAADGSPVIAWNAEDSATLIYTGNDTGRLTAYNQATGLPVWTDTYSAGVTSTPIVDGSSIWVAPGGERRLYKLDAGTGAVQCSAPLPYETYSSPTIATPPGGSSTVYIGVTTGGGADGPLVAVNEANCTVDFTVSPAPIAGTGGIWDGISYGVDATGVGLVVFGTSDPDSSVYAINAITGALVWRFVTNNPAPHTYDVGAGVTLSPPGVNGFTDGVAYAINKFGALYALNLTTGSQIWSAQVGGSLATPALYGTSLVLADGGNITCVNAITGAIEWTDPTGARIDAAPAIIGPAGSQVVAVGDLNGVVHIVSLATGTGLYSYQTGNFIAASPAEVDGNLIIAGGDGWLYDFAPGGGNGAHPTTSITYPVTSSTVKNPNGSLVLTGKATPAESSPVSRVTVAVQEDGAAGPWWDGASQTWVTAPYPNPATLTTTSAGIAWSLALPMPSEGGTFEAFASAVGSNGLADLSASSPQASAARSSFSVHRARTSPVLTANAYWVAPGSAVMVSGSDFTAGDSIQVSLNGAALETVTASSKGSLPKRKVQIPKTGAFGPAAIEAVDQSNGDTGNAPVYVTNEWTTQGESPFHHAFEPNDSVFHHFPITNTFTSAWSFTSTGSVDGSPVIAHATAYVADTSGTVTAIGVQTGMERWQVTVGTGSPIIVTPGLEDTGSAAALVVGNEAGSLFALNTSTGSTLWTATLGSPVTSAPVIEDGLVYVGTQSGTLYAVDASTGAVAWHATLPGDITGAAAVDPKAGLVLAGDSTGDLTALTATNGTVKWQTSTGSAPIVTDPLLASGDAYVGTKSGGVAAVSESSGQLVWTDKLKANVTASLALYGSDVLVGDSAGTVYALAASTGSVLSSTGYKNGAVVGIAVASGFSLVVSVDGFLSGYKGLGPGKGKWSATMGASGMSAPVVLNGVAYAIDAQGVLHCYTVAGKAPA